MVLELNFGKLIPSQKKTLGAPPENMLLIISAKQLMVDSKRKLITSNIQVMVSFII